MHKINTLHFLIKEFNLLYYFITLYLTFKSPPMKKLNKDKMKSIMAGGEICLECAIGYYQVIIDGHCYCVPID